MAGLGIWGAVRPLDPHDVPSPDPNHAHADFAVWFDDMQVNFAREEFMSGSSDEHDPNHYKHDQYFHLHDGNGHVVHRHKPGLPISEFFASLGMKFTKDCFRIDAANAACIGPLGTLRMLVNGKEIPVNPDYVFEDLDQILIILAANDDEIIHALAQMTDDACLYSQRCPWRGAPPAENCIADPAVPCVE